MADCLTVSVESNIKTEKAGTCKDVNECALNVSKCFDDAICENNPGGYTCKCPSGFGDAIK